MGDINARERNQVFTGILQQSIKNATIKMLKNGNTTHDNMEEFQRAKLNH